MLVLWVVTCFRQYIKIKLKLVVPKEQGNEMFDVYMKKSFEFCTGKIRYDNSR